MIRLPLHISETIPYLFMRVQAFILIYIWTKLSRNTVSKLDVSKIIYIYAKIHNFKQANLKNHVWIY